MSLESIDDPSNQPGPSKVPSPPICTLCNTSPSKYTCPRCQTKTCSLPCSRAHKAATGCSGERNRTAFVPMSQYNYGALVNDYVYLEEVGRQVEVWGRDIVRDGITARSESNATIRGSSMRGRGRGKGRAIGQKKDRRTFLAMQLGLRDIDMDVLPSGMDRAKRNLSKWDSEGKRALFTVELIFKPPPDPITRQETQSLSLTTSKNDWDRTIRQIISTSVSESRKTQNHEPLLHWLSLEEEDDTIPSSVLCLMKRPRAHDDPLDLNPARPSYYKLDWNTKLSRALRNKHFVEFPTIILMDENAFDGILIDDKGFSEDVQERHPKRRKLDIAQAKRTISGLVGDYGSDDDSEDDLGVLNTLGDYSESEGDDGDAPEPGEVLDEVDSEHMEDFRDILGVVQAPEVLVAIGEDDEDVDWGNDEIAEDEERIARLTAAIQQRHP